MAIKTKLTPVRYPGGKSNALKTLDEFFIKDFVEYREPFFGGGSVGLYLMQFNKEASYWINDLFYPVYCFWKVLYEYPTRMMEFLLEQKIKYTIDGDVKIKGIKSKSAEAAKELHTYCRVEIEKAMEDKDEFTTACLWYILNKTSYSGLAMIGSYAPLAWDQNFTLSCIDNLYKTHELLHSVKSVKITNLDYFDLLGGDVEDVFIFLDPPYDIKHNLYGNKGNMHRGFDHIRFIEQTTKCKHKWMITYNQTPEFMSGFKDFRLVLWELQYTMKAAKREKQEGSESTGKSGKLAEELLIMNYGQQTPAGYFSEQ
jgi:DNA adenine methylase